MMGDADAQAPIQLLYFASLAQQLGCSEEKVRPDQALNSVLELQQWLISRGGSWDALASDKVRCAVNQEVVKLEHPIQPGDEVAFFPPVTGG